MKYSKEQTQALLQKIENSLKDYLFKNNIYNPLIIGVNTGGAWIADLLQKNLGYEGKAASLNISFYRDDFSKVGVNPRVEPTEMPISIDDKHVILVDDVLYTGRTIRAALTAIETFGRPKSIELLILVDRRFSRELPIQPDYKGIQVDVYENQKVNVEWNDGKLGNYIYLENLNNE